MVLPEVVKQLGREVNQSPPSIAEVNNEWRYTSAPPICLHDAGKQLCLHLYTEAVLRQCKFFTRIKLNNTYDMYVGIDTRAHTLGK